MDLLLASIDFFLLGVTAQVEGVAPYQSFLHG